MLKQGILDFSDSTTKVDVYSFSIVMFELITGCAILRGLSPRNIMDLVLSGKRPIVSQIQMQLLPSKCEPHEYQQVLDLLELAKKCWAPKPDLRPDFGVVIKELERIESFNK